MIARPLHSRFNTLVLASWAPLAATALFILATSGPTESAVRLVLRTSARYSFALFVLAFLASPLHALLPSRTTDWLARNRRSLGLSFAAAHFTAGAAVLTYRVLFPASFSEVTYPLQRIGGSVGFLAILLMVVTSFPRPRRLLGESAWKALHTTCLYFICLNYMVSFGRRVLLYRLPFYVPFFLMLLAAIGVRIAAGLSRPRHEAAPPIG